VTPREADVAMALETCEGVSAVFAVDAPPHGLNVPAVAAPYEFAVVLQPYSSGNVVRAHARLLAVLTREETGRVAFVDADARLQPSYMTRARRLVPTPTERQAAQARIAARGSVVDDDPLEELAPDARLPALRARVLVLGARPSTVEPALRALGADFSFIDDVRVAATDRLTVRHAAEEVRAGRVDLLIVEMNAFWQRGRLAMQALIARFDPLANRHFLMLGMANLPPWARVGLAGCPSLRKPLDAEQLRAVLERSTRWRRPRKSSPG
jgi:hypothetical protein